MAVINLSIYVANISSVLPLFDQMEIWRSTTGSEGVYTEITAAADQPASLTGTGLGPFSLQNKTLQFSVNQGDEQTVTFVSPIPLDISEVVNIMDAVDGLSASESNGHLVLTTELDGTAATLEITGGSALADLGFTEGQYDSGEDERIDLQLGTTTYEYADQSGYPDNYYKVRYYNSGTGAFSSFGNPVEGAIGSIVPPSDLVKASGTFAGLDGKPVEGMAIVFYNVYSPPLAVGGIGIVGREVRIETDQAGYAETMLVKGAIVDITLSGTGIIRRVVVPTTDFDILAVISVADDGFQIQIPDIPAAVRMS